MKRTGLNGDLLANLRADGPDVDGGLAVVLNDSLADCGSGGDESGESGDGETHLGVLDVKIGGRVDVIVNVSSEVN